MASLMTIPTEIRMKIWECALPEEVDTTLQYARPEGEDDALLVPVNPALPLLLACRKARDEVMTMPKPILSIVIDDLDMLEALQLSAYSTRNAIGRIKFIGHYIGLTEAMIDRWWSRSEEQDRTSFVVNNYRDWKMVHSILGTNERIAGNEAFGRHRKAYQIEFEVSGAIGPSWNTIYGYIEHRRKMQGIMTVVCTMPVCRRFGAARERLIGVRRRSRSGEMRSGSEEMQRIARRWGFDI